MAKTYLSGYSDQPIDAISAAGGQKPVTDFSGTRADYSYQTNVVNLFEEQVLNDPNALAIVFEDDKLTYAELNARSNRLANYLKRNGVCTETLVPICMERGPELIVGILAILKSGGAYVPIDPECPADRIIHIIKDTNAKLLLCNGLRASRNFLNARLIDIKEHDELIGKESSENPCVVISPCHLAYVIYTSGSTGKPKGVMIEHQSLVNYISNCKSSYINSKTGNAATFAHFSYAFDASLIGLFTPLLSGRYLVIASKQSAAIFEDRNLEKYAPYDFITVTPSHIALLPIDFKNAGGNWLTERLIVGGEALRANHLEPLTKAGINISIVNEYGPTETTVGCSSYSFYALDAPVFAQSVIPIGNPIANMQMYIVNEDNELNLIDVPGEIWIGGVGLARGYLNLAEMTAERFLESPFNMEPGARLYKTGDLGKWLPDGSIMYLGRKDDQVKIRGYRVEPGEIESVLNGSGLVKQGVVLAKEDKHGIKRLVVYVVSIKKLDKKGICDYMRARLPEYMVPALWVELDALPLTENGKVDRKALPDPDLNSVDAMYVAPRNQTEAVLALMWKEMLGLERVGIYDNFFELGGHSLLAMRIVSAIRRELKIEVDFKDIFVHPSIDGLISRVKSKNKIYSPLLIPLREAGNKTPLYLICGAGGTVFKFMDLVKLLDAEQTIFGLQQPLNADSLNSLPTTIEGIADMYLEEIFTHNPNGPYALAGHCLGGSIAFEMAVKLKAMGKQVAMLVVFDPFPINEEEILEVALSNYRRLRLIVTNAFSKIWIKIKFELFLLLRHPKEDFQYKKEKIRSLLRIKKTGQDEIEMSSFNDVTKLFETAARAHRTKYYDGEVLIFYPEEKHYFTDLSKQIVYKRIYRDNGEKNIWSKYAAGIKIYETGGEHSTMFDSKHVTGLAGILQSSLAVCDKSTV